MSRVLSSDKLSEQAVAVFRDRGIDVEFSPGLSAEDLIARMQSEMDRDAREDLLIDIEAASWNSIVEARSSDRIGKKGGAMNRLNASPSVSLPSPGP